MPINTTLEERVKIVEWSAAGEPTWRIARELGWSMSTIRKWRLRGQKEGRAGLVSYMGRPRRGALSSYPEAIGNVLSGWRQAHPGWGPKTLRTELEQDERFAAEKLPSLAAIGRFLKEQGFTQFYEKHSDLPQTEAESPGEPHDVWELDARGHEYVPDVGVVSLVQVNDRHSHIRLLSYPCWLGDKRMQRRANTSDYQTVLRLAFADWGLPKSLQVDHESVFYDNTSKSPFPTRFQLWLLALGVSLQFGRVGCPTDQGMTERSHQLWYKQVLQGATFNNWDALYMKLRERRDFLNCHLPCASLNQQPPLRVFPDAHHSSRNYRPEWEHDMLDLDRIYAYLAEGRWFRKISDNGTFSLGAQVYYVGQQWKHRQAEITFQPDSKYLSLFDEAGKPITQLPLKGLSVEYLQGELSQVLALPAFQLCLPFSWNDQRLLRLYEMALDTT